MKIGLLYDAILPPANYGGIERVVMALAESYKKTGHQVVIMAKTGSHLPDYEYQPLPENFLGQSWEFLPKGLDFLHLHQPVLSEPPVPHLLTIHGNAQPGERYIANSCFLTKSHAGNHDSEVFVHNGLDVNRYPFKEQKQDYYVFLARARWRVKNLRTALDWARDLNVSLKVMGGTGWSRGKIEYCGLVGENEGKLEILSNAKALIYPTNWNEPFGLAVMEALACGTPVIASANGSMPDLIQPDVGVVCENYGEMLKAREKLTNIRPEVCRAYVEKNFSAEKMANDYLNLYQKIMTDGGLKQHPGFGQNQTPVKLLYKPSWNRKLELAMTGKI